MLNRLIFFIILLNACSQINHAQNLHWAAGIGGIGSDQGESIYTDKDGNVYVTGSFQDTADFDPGPGIYSLTAYGARDAFVTKLDKSGNHVWSIQFGGLNSALTAGNSISVDDSGNVLVTGGFIYLVDFDPGPGVYNLSALGNNTDAFICKLSPGGSFIWAIKIGNNSWDNAYDITTDAFGNIYTSGYKDIRRNT